MRLLAIETAAENCSAALLVDGEVVVRCVVEPRGHARLILPMADELLAGAGLALADLDALAFGRGPGSFTGVRIAAGVVQGAALAADLPVVPVSTLAALAQQCADLHGSDRVAAALDARMGEVYWGAFVRGDDGLVVAAGAESVCPPEAVTLPEGGGWYGAGSGYAAHGAALSARLGAALGPIDGALLPRAEEVVRLAARDFAAGLAVAAELAQPVYLRDRVTHGS